MAKLTLKDITSGHGSQDLYNENNTLIETALENTLSRDGTTPNTMSADLDMNSNAILNVSNWATNLNWTGDWATATSYSVGDTYYVPVGTGSAFDGYTLYVQVAHTSTTVDADNASGYTTVVVARGAEGAAGSGGLSASNNLSDLDSLTTSLNNLITAHGPLATADIADDAITLAKLASGTAGDLLTWDSSGDPTTIAAGTSGYVLTSNGAGAEPTWQTSSLGTAATQAEMETATSTTVTVTPGRAQHHPSAAKAWCKFVGSSGAISAGYNVASVSRTGAGRYNILFTNPMSTGDYAIVAQPTNFSSGGGDAVCTISRLTPATTGFTIRADDAATSLAKDPDHVFFVCYGDL